MSDFDYQRYKSNRGDDRTTDSFVFHRKEDKRRLRQSFGNGTVGNVAVGISNWLDRAIAESQERDRILSNESRLKEFQAWQECPKCNRFGHYPFEKVNLGDRNVKRKCSNCGYEWYQR